VVADAMKSFYADEPFVAVLDRPPATKSVLGSNAVHVSARYDPRTNTVISICAIDNLTKGASGGAVQAANVAVGLEETAGLPMIGLAP
jgi:N-acetyl-gamma-glutamyl-phosphate reductase